MIRINHLGNKPTTNCYVVNVGEKTKSGHELREIKESKESKESKEITEIKERKKTNTASHTDIRPDRTFLALPVRFCTRR